MSNFRPNMNPVCSNNLNRTAEPVSTVVGTRLEFNTNQAPTTAVTNQQRSSSSRTRVRTTGASSVFALTGGSPMPHMSVPRVRPLNVYPFSHMRRYPSGIQQTSSIVDVGYTFQFSLDSLDGYTELVSVFDQYRIKEIEIWTVPWVINHTGNTQPGMFASVIDYDDAATLNLNDALQYGTCMVSSAVDGHYRRFAPAVVGYVEPTGGLTSGREVKISPWLDAASSNVVHRGVKYVVGPTAAQRDFDVVIRYHLEFRCNR